MVKNYVAFRRCYGYPYKVLSAKYYPNGIDNLLIGIELDFHVRHLFLDCGFIIPQDKAFFL